MSVMIGVDPHKATHPAVAIDCTEAELSRAKVRATRRQVQQLLAWAEPLGGRIWAIESAAGLGHLLAQQLVSAGDANRATWAGPGGHPGTSLSSSVAGFHPAHRLFGPSHFPDPTTNRRPVVDRLLARAPSTKAALPACWTTSYDHAPIASGSPRCMNMPCACHR